MSITAGGRVALILCVGVLGVGLAGAPSEAAPSQSENVSTAKTVKQVRYFKRYANRKHVRASQKSSPAPKAAEIAEAGGAVTIPASVANANAAMVADAPTGAAKAMTMRANALLVAAADTPAEPTAPAADTQVVAADQLNEVDRTLQEQPANAQTTVALAPTRPVAAVVSTAAANDTSTWDQTSLIGKIFIAFGALLTIASAARMFMA
jgi:hypothetical protein